MAVPRPVYDDFERAVAEFRPDVVMMHWAHYAQSQLPRMEAHELPFGVRVHSFDFDEEIIRALMLHPLCAGVWTYPSERYSVEGTQRAAAGVHVRPRHARPGRRARGGRVDLRRPAEEGLAAAVRRASTAFPAWCGTS